MEAEASTKKKKEELQKMGSSISQETPGVIDAPKGINLSSFEFLPDFSLICIGKGSFGLVNIMKKTTPSQKLYAVKSMNKSKLISKEFIPQTLNELKLLCKIAQLKHPNIVNIHYAFQDESKLYIVLDLCLGGSLRHRLKKFKKIDVPSAKFYLTEIITGLKFLHKHKIIHCDVKPDNILIDISGRIRISDFNISCLKGSMLIQNEKIWGTKGYIAPEMYSKNGFGYSSDWWSCGATFFEMLTGTLPYGLIEGETTFDPMLNRIENEQFNLALVPDLKHLRVFVKNLLKFHPNQRLNDDNIENQEFVIDGFINIENFIPKNDQKNLNDLSIFSENFDVSLDNKEKMKLINSKLDDYGFHDKPIFENNEEPLSKEQQEKFVIWSYNSEYPELSPKELVREDIIAETYPLIEQISQISSLQEFRNYFIETVDDNLIDVRNELLSVHRRLLELNSKVEKLQSQLDQINNEKNE